ncbi:Cell cycle checkpoint protein rad17 [Operophtera brumata]|uniref:Cell cycle checkpoint protein rad17 n=1 Tax=Operophtera brumata TaxID=104452 RepID=A0A0L7LVJ8_OPEBR|nr:Cell cycle checkpoint protein rad17 [Operophtera brumata]
MAEFDDDDGPPKNKKPNLDNFNTKSPTKGQQSKQNGNVDEFSNVGSRNWMKNFDPVNVEELAVHTKKVQEVEEWLKVIHTSNCSDILLLTGPVGCGKTSTLLTLASKYGIKVTEWITPLDIEMPTEYGKPLSNQFMIN